MTIRPSSEADQQALMELYPRAFPDEDLAELVTDVLACPDAQSYLAEDKGEVIGHIGFTDCGVAGSDLTFSMLSPLAVAPERQRQGVGKALIADGLHRLRERGIAKLFVLGDPKYYSRSGFTQEMKVLPPQPVRNDWMPAWQSIALEAEGETAAGMLKVPAFWDRPDYWS
ncbi:MAG: N-acetyltransferase [Devosiaceae bacterium]|nr:N-acetyltransferase [Devosiaceae bacterium MH13]